MTQVGNSLRSIVKLLLKSRPSGVTPRDRQGESLIIMGNGPSLREVLDNDLDKLCQSHTMAVNFAANAPEFFELKPRYYTLADPHFFNPGHDTNVDRLIENINRVSWDMTIFVPRQALKKVRENINSTSVTVTGYNAIGVEGWKWLTKLAYSRRWGMPRPRNVLVPSIMIGAWLGYKEIYLLGADHTWPLMLSVTDENRVITNQPHFYTDNDKERQRVKEVYATIPLHEIFKSFYIAFRSYHEIREWCRSQGIAIYNATKGSFIDAFERRNWPQR